MKTLKIDHMSPRGEGVAIECGEKIFVPFALTGETVSVRIEGHYAELIDILAPSPQRVQAICRFYGQCGGCAVQTLTDGAYAAWKISLLENAAQREGLNLKILPMINAQGSGRRRVALHARMSNGIARVGFMASRSHRLVEINHCPLLVAELKPALKAAQDLSQILASREKPLDLAVTATPEGMDIDIRGAGDLASHETNALVKTAQAHRLARLTNHGRLVTLTQTPWIDIEGTRTPLPPGVFLQATQTGEEIIALKIKEALKKSKTVADLFCGIGAFSLRIAHYARVAAYDNNPLAIDALCAATRQTAGLKPLQAETRDLFNRPLTPQELVPFDTVVFDPPRAGALAQAKCLARSNVKTIAAVSCNAQSFCRDAAILIAGGYSMSAITPIDQFMYSSHLELVAIFTRRSDQPQDKRRLLG
mgnify:FL=1